MLPDAELVIVPDAGHLVMLEHPEVVNDRLADLLARGGAAARVPGTQALRPGVPAPRHRQRSRAG